MRRRGYKGKCEDRILLGSTKESFFWASEGEVSSGIAKKGFFWVSEGRALLGYLFWVTEIEIYRPRFSRGSK